MSKILQIFMIISSFSYIQLSCWTIFHLNNLWRSKNFSLYRLFRVVSFTQGWSKITNTQLDGFKNSQKFTQDPYDNKERFIKSSLRSIWTPGGWYAQVFRMTSTRKNWVPREGVFWPQLPNQLSKINQMFMVSSSLSCIQLSCWMIFHLNNLWR